MLNLDGLDEEKINKLQVKKEKHPFKRDNYHYIIRYIFKESHSEKSCKKRDAKSPRRIREDIL